MFNNPFKYEDKMVGVPHKSLSYNECSGQVADSNAYFATRYWVGGSGNLDGSDTAHIASASGGGGGASYPGASDDLILDGSSGGGTVTCTANLSVLSLTGGAHTGTFSFGTGRTITIGTGGFSWSGTGTRTLSLGDAQISMASSSATAWTTQTATNLTISANTATITFTGGGWFNPSGGQNYQGVSLVFNLTNASSGIAGSGTETGIANITVTGNSGANSNFQSAANYTLTGTLTINGFSTSRHCGFQSNTGGTARTISAATVVITNCDISDITGAGAASWNFSAQNDIGNAGGTTNITFPAQTTQTWSGTSGGNFYSNGWTTRIPLLQDIVLIPVAFIGGQSITIDTPRCPGISFLGATGNPTVNFNNGGFSTQIFGSIYIASGMTIGGTSTNVFFVGRGSYTITSNGVSFASAISISTTGGTYTLADAFTTTGTFTVASGTFISAGFAGTSTTFISTGSTTRAITLSTSTWTLTSTAATNIINIVTGGLTFSGASSTFTISTVSANTRTIITADQVFGTLNYIISGSTGELDITLTSTVSFAAINFYDASNARTIKFTNGTTITIRNLNGYNVRGSNGKLMVAASISGAAFTMTSPNQQATDYINPTNMVVDASPKWYAGSHSTDGGGNTNLIFTDDPNVGGHMFGDEGMVS